VSDHPYFNQQQNDETKNQTDGTIGCACNENADSGGVQPIGSSEGDSADSAKLWCQIKLKDSMPRFNIALAGANNASRGRYGPTATIESSSSRWLGWIR